MLVALDAGAVVLSGDVVLSFVQCIVDIISVKAHSRRVNFIIYGLAFRIVRSRQISKFQITLELD